MKILELFAGSRSVGKVAEARGHQVFSTDIKPFENIDQVGDILNLDPRTLPYVPDFIWASPDCTTWSIASCSTHWDTSGNPRTEAAKNGVRMVQKLLEIIDYYRSLNPDLKWAFENPRGMLRKHALVAGLTRTTVWYCRYGDTRAKPTDIWTNLLDTWEPRPMCFNGNPNCHHDPAPRGSRTGTQGIKGSYDRSRIPFELVNEILDSLEVKTVAPRFEQQGVLFA